MFSIFIHCDCGGGFHEHVILFFKSNIGLLFCVEILNIKIKSITNFIFLVLNEAYLVAPVSCKRK